MAKFNFYYTFPLVDKLGFYTVEAFTEEFARKMFEDNYPDAELLKIFTYKVLDN